VRAALEKGRVNSVSGGCLANVKDTVEKVDFGGALGIGP
jgi:hypothetical protein